MDIKLESLFFYEVLKKLLYGDSGVEGIDLLREPSIGSEWTGVRYRSQLTESLSVK